MKRHVLIPSGVAFFSLQCSWPLERISTSTLYCQHRPPQKTLRAHTHARTYTPQRGRLSLGLSSHVTSPAAVTACSARFICVHRSVHESVYVLMCVCTLAPYVLVYRKLKLQSQNSHPLYTAVSAHAIYTSTQSQRKTRYLPMRCVVFKKKRKIGRRFLCMHV